MGVASRGCGGSNITNPIHEKGTQKLFKEDTAFENWFAVL